MLFQFGKNHSFTRHHIIALLLLFNSFSWYFLGLLMVNKLANVVAENSLTNLYLRSAFPLSIIVSALIGSIFWLRARKTSFFYIWLFFGTIASLFPAVPIGNSFAGAIIVIVVLGISLGFGMPSLLRSFTESVPIENRGTIGGLTFFMVTASAPFVIVTMSMLDLVQSAMFFAIWRSWSIPILLAFPKKSKSQLHYERKTSFLSIFNNKAFVLYFLAWLMFSMVDGFEARITFLHKEELGFAMNVVEPIFAGFSALIGGVVADRIGRKRVIIFGFVSLGIAYAILGIASHLWISWFLYFAIDGIAIGLLWMMFTIVIWGELSRFNTEKYYAVGEAPFFLTMIASLLVAPYVALIPETSAFSLAAFFLFIAVIPLLYVRETLPEKKIQQPQLEIYTEEALKLRQKVEQKSK